MTDQEMQAMQAMMEQVMDNKLQPINEKLDTLQEDVSMLKEESAITRHSVNLLLKWAEKADRSVNVGLYE
jgi:hypothetical protein